MRISIRNQLAALVLLSSLVCLTVISVSTWYSQHARLSQTRAARFAIIASLKAAQLSSNLALMERSVRSLSSRARVQGSLLRYNQGNDSTSNWDSTIADLQSALAGQRSQLLTLQTIVYPRDATGGGDTHGLLNVTGTNVQGNIQLPYTDGNGPVYLGQSGLGYPPDLYPNLTYIDPDGTPMAQFAGQVLDADSALLLGPLEMNSTASLVSLTVPVINNTSLTDIVGYMTVVMDGGLIFDVVNSTIGLLQTGTTLLIGPDTINNQVANSTDRHLDTVEVAGTSVPNIDLKFVIPPQEKYQAKRHADYAYGKDQVFQGSKYPLILKTLVDGNADAINDAGGTLTSRNEENKNIGVGYARPDSTFCDWVLAVEFSHDEAWGPIDAIQKVLLACIFATAFGAAFWTFPIAHFSSAPIRRLRDATRNAVDPPEEYSHEHPEETPISTPEQDIPAIYDKDGAAVTEKPTGFSHIPGGFLRRKRGEPTLHAPIMSDGSSFAQRIKIPQRVKDRHHFIEDELTDLTKVFNEMCDELTTQYTRLEDRVRQRTAELELSKKAAEAANESKTLFIANISHELKTPLNGILGMCAVAMAEEDPSKIKRSLNIIYKSGDLLHHLLTDLLTFSKHQVGKNLSLDEKEFRLRDVGAQLHAIFFTQARDGQIDFTVEYQGPQDAYGNPQPFDDGDFGPDHTGKVRDMVLWGDVQRILQVAINLISNSLKFTGKGGTVKLRIRCVEMVTSEPVSRQASLTLAERRKVGRGSAQDVRSSREAVDSGANRRPSLSSQCSDQPPDANAPKLHFCFEVEDTGPGIAPHLQSQIFEPFVQGDLRLTKKFGGTGLGLSICSQLATLMHGKLDLNSTLGEGSTFTMKIPLRLCRTRADSSDTSMIDVALANQVDQAPNSPSVHLSRASSVHKSDRSPSPNKAIEQISSESKPRLVGLSQPYFSTGKPPMASPNSDPQIVTLKREGKLKVLVAEDNMTNAEVVTRMLKLEEVFDVSLAKDGQEALEKVKESMALGVQYDLIFMDVQMPNLDGRESTRLIRDLGYSAPIVALTAFSDEINQRECLDSGMDYFLPKPIKRPALKQVLKTYCAPIQEEDEPRSRKMSEMNPFTKDVPPDKAPPPASPHVDPFEKG